ncbi:MAG: hypothetical protein HOP19_01295 [Acidobacteria bacterium]|nr:hypothetical protein [Acidobacteriota bacterium]
MSSLPASLAQRLEALRLRFIARYGTGEVRFLSAPARINILGEHIDYVSYLPTVSLTFGSDRHAMWMAYRPNPNGDVRGASTNETYPPFNFSLPDASDELRVAADWETYVFSRPAPASHWSNYVRGASQYAQWQQGNAIQQGVDFLIDSTIPACGGSSSSSALTCLAGAALRAVNGLAFTAHELALDSARAEWFVGTRGGAMDHQTICLSQPGAAVVIHHDTQKTKTVALPAAGYAWVTFFSHEADKGSRVMLEYNARAAVSRIVIPTLLSAFVVPPLGVRVQSPPPEGGTTNALPEFITLSEFARNHSTAFAVCERLFPQLVREHLREALPVRAYAEHHAGEIRRVAQALEWLRAEAVVTDDTMRKLGGLLNETHASLRDLYGVSTPEVETLRDMILREPSVYGARLMGGGFGGNVLALVQAEAVSALIEKIQREFYAPQGRNALAEGAVMVSLPEDGLRALFLPSEQNEGSEAG